MSDQYSMFLPPTSPGSLNATSSPGSASGPTPSGAPAGPTIGPCGPVPALASLSPRQAKEMGLLTSGTYGRRSSISSESAALGRSLANRLARTTALLGSTMYGLTWKERVTPWGLRISALRASALRTRDNDCTLWPTPVCEDWKNDGSKTLERVVSNGMMTCDQRLRNLVQLIPWPSPKVSRGKYQYSGGDHSKIVLNLEGAVMLVLPWATPASRDWKDTGDLTMSQFRKDGKMRNDTVPRQAQLMASGLMQNGSTVTTKSTGQLNPAFSRWLQGLPKEWCEAAIRAHRSMPTRQRKHG